ncbi:hypothetical protein M0R45_000832 [Rubus argutus]|uniref:Uncharacterized protein n=1 Tax=Rubus argutus TaxID=59490 RepID=A0AAW1VKA2_RUBAR
MEWSRFACRLPHGPLSLKDGIAPPPGALSSFCCDEIREGNGSGGGGGGALRGLRLAQDINAMTMCRLLLSSDDKWSFPARSLGHVELYPWFHMRRVFRGRHGFGLSLGYGPCVRIPF